jgi:cysteine synthase B
MGAGRRLRELKPDIQLISMEPDSPFHGLEGLKHMETAIVPGIYDPVLANRKIADGTEESHAMARLLARREGWFVGVSSAANVVAALSVARELEAGTIVTVLCDGGVKYLSDKFWGEDER